VVGSLRRGRFWANLNPRPRPALFHRHPFAAARGLTGFRGGAGPTRPSIRSPEKDALLKGAPATPRPVVSGLGSRGPGPAGLATTEPHAGPRKPTGTREGWEGQTVLYLSRRQDDSPFSPRAAGSTVARVHGCPSPFCRGTWGLATGREAAWRPNPSFFGVRRFTCRRPLLSASGQPGARVSAGPVANFTHPPAAALQRAGAPAFWRGRCLSRLNWPPLNHCVRGRQSNRLRVFAIQLWGFRANSTKSENRGRVGNRNRKRPRRGPSGSPPEQARSSASSSPNGQAERRIGPLGTGSFREAHCPRTGRVRQPEAGGQSLGGAGGRTHLILYQRWGWRSGNSTRVPSSGTGGDGWDGPSTPRLRRNRRAGSGPQPAWPQFLAPTALPPFPLPCSSGTQGGEPRQAAPGYVTSGFRL